MNNWYVYIVKAADNTLYTGTTTDIEKRVKTHNSKKGSKSLLGKLPVKLVYSEQVGSRSSALKREAEIKNWKRDKKLTLISNSGIADRLTLSE